MEHRWSVFEKTGGSFFTCVAGIVDNEKW